MNFLTTPVLYGLGLVAALSLAVAGVQSYRLNSERADGAACQADRANFAATQKGNLDTIANLSHRLAVIAQARRVESEAATKALLEADKLAMAADRHNDELSRELAALYARDAGAQTWGSGGVDAGVAEKLPGAGR